MSPAASRIYTLPMKIYFRQKIFLPKSGAPEINPPLFSYLTEKNFSSMLIFKVFPNRLGRVTKVTLSPLSQPLLLPFSPYALPPLFLIIKYIRFPF